MDEKSDGRLNWVTTLGGLGTLTAAIYGIWIQASARHDETEAKLERMAERVDGDERAAKDAEIYHERQEDMLHKSRDDAIASIRAAIGEIDKQKNLNTAAIAALSHDIVSLGAGETEGAKELGIDLQRQIDNVGDRLGDIGKRIDAANERLAEIQRQTSAIEGSLGNSAPHQPVLPK